MQVNSNNPLIEREKNIERAKKADKFWSAFLLTKDGKVKSTLLLNSFCMCVALIAVYAAAFVLLLGPLKTATAGMPAWVGNLVGALVPAVVGSVVCLLTFPLFKEKRTLPCAYLWLFILLVACLITMLILLRGEKAATALMLQFFVLFTAAPLFLGGAGALVLYRRWAGKHSRSLEIRK